jgi:competence protein ComGC
VVESCGCAEIEQIISSKEMRIEMQKKKTFSTMEIILLVVIIGSLILSFLQTWLDEKKHGA